MVCGVWLYRDGKKDVINRLEFCGFHSKGQFHGYNIQYNQQPPSARKTVALDLRSKVTMSDLA